MEINPETTRVGWIGTGVMGQSMCGRVLDAGYKVSVFNRSPAKAQGLAAAGARLCANPAEVAESSDVVFTIVGYPRDLEEVLMGAGGVLAAMGPGGMVVDMTTSEPGLAVRIEQQARQLGLIAIDAPVSGGDVGAKNGTLSIMIGGEKTAVERLRPLFELMGKTIVHQGPAGAGQHTKMVNQTLIATNMIGVCEALLYAYRAGLDLEQVMRSVASGAAGSWSLSNLGPRIIANQFDPGFFVEHFIKDMEIALQEARKMALPLPGLALAHQLYVALAAQGGSRQGTHALQLALSRLSAIDWLNREPTNT